MIDDGSDGSDGDKRRPMMVVGVELYSPGGGAAPLRVLDAAHVGHVDHGTGIVHELADESTGEERIYMGFPFVTIVRPAAVSPIITPPGLDRSNGRRIVGG